MSDVITTGVFGTLIFAAVGYLAAQINRLGDRVERLDERLTGEVHGLGERLARVETEVRSHTGALDRVEHKIDEHLRAHHAGSA